MEVTFEILPVIPRADIAYSLYFTAHPAGEGACPRRFERAAWTPNTVRMVYLDEQGWNGKEQEKIFAE